MPAKSRRARGAVPSADPSPNQRTADSRPRTADSARTEGQRLLLLVPGSLTDLTARLGAGRSTVSDWRRGAKLPEHDARVRLHAAYGIPVSAWDRKPERAADPMAPAPPTLATSPYADLDPDRRHRFEAEDAEIERQLDELTGDIPDEMAMHHPLYRDMHAAVLAVLPDRSTRYAVMNAVAEVEDAIGRDGWRPERRTTPPSTKGQTP